MKTIHIAIASLMLAASSLHVRAGTPDIVGTWKYSETVILEFLADGVILSNSRPAGKWARRDQSANYLITLNDASRFTTSLDRYKRILTAEPYSHGARRIMSRLDGGPTVNPDVPDERTALDMECADLEKCIRDSQADAAAAKRQASEYLEKHHAARAIGRISSWNLEAKRAENRARGMEQAASNAHARLVELKSQLVMK